MSVTTSVLLAAAAGEGGHEPSLTAVGIGVVLLALNAFFVAAEIALLAARRVRIEELADSGDPRGQLALNALKELSVTFSGAQLGITMTSLGLGAIAEPAVAGYLERWLEPVGLSEGVTTTLGFSIALGIVVFLHMVVGEMVPKNLALSSAETVSMRLARPFRLFVTLFRPLILVLNATANGVVRLLGVEPVDEHGLVHTADELVLAVGEAREAGLLEEPDARILRAVLRLTEIDAEAGMTPRVDLVALPDTARPSEVLEVAEASGHTRFPVYHGEIDRVVGAVHVKDLLIDPATLRADDLTDLLRPLPAVPESRDLEHLLGDMRSGNEHAALVVDEHGGTAGLITLEDVIEELLGEIADEYDTDGMEAEVGDDGPWEVPGTLRKDELHEQVGLDLPHSNAETVSGWMTEEVGRLLEEGDTVDHDGWRLVVKVLEGRRAGTVVVRHRGGGTASSSTPAGDDDARGA